MIYLSYSWRLQIPGNNNAGIKKHQTIEVIAWPEGLPYSAVHSNAYMLDSTMYGRGQWYMFLIKESDADAKTIMEAYKSVDNLSSFTRNAIRAMIGKAYNKQLKK